MSGIIAVYALVVAVLIAGNMKPPPALEYSVFAGCMHLACGLSVGLTGLAAGYAIGQVGDTVRKPQHNKRRPRSSMLIGCCSGCESVHATVTDLRRHGTDFDFRGSAGSIRVSVEMI